MEFNKIYLTTFIDDLKYAVESGRAAIEKDEGMRNPITKEQYLRFVAKLEDGFKVLIKDIENLEKEVESIKRKKL